MEYFTVDEGAELLKLHPKTVLRKIREGELGATRIGRQYRISRDQIDTFCGGPQAAQNPSSAKTRQVLASSVIDIEAISPDEGTRITNTLMAALNNRGKGTRQGQAKSRVDCLYYEETGRLKVIVYGGLEETESLLQILRSLLDPKDG